MAAGRFVVSLGGEHSLTTAPVRAARRVFGAAVRSTAGGQHVRKLPELKLGFVGLGKCVGQTLDFRRDFAQKIEVQRLSVK